MTSLIPALADMPVVQLDVSDPDNLYSVLDWQRVGARVMVKHYLKADAYLDNTIEQCRYFHVPVGNLPKDQTSSTRDT